MDTVNSLCFLQTRLPALVPDTPTMSMVFNRRPTSCANEVSMTLPRINRSQSSKAAPRMAMDFGSPTMDPTVRMGASIPPGPGPAPYDAEDADFSMLSNLDNTPPARPEAPSFQRPLHRPVHAATDTETEPRMPSVADADVSISFAMSSVERPREAVETVTEIVLPSYTQL
eukprot:gene17930-5651_t